VYINWGIGGTPTQKSFFSKSLAASFHSTPVLLDLNSVLVTLEYL